MATIARTPSSVNKPKHRWSDGLPHSNIGHSLLLPSPPHTLTATPTRCLTSYSVSFKPYIHKQLQSVALIWMHLMTVTLWGASVLFSSLGPILDSQGSLLPLDSGFEFPRRLAPVIRKASARRARDTRVIFVEVEKKKKNLSGHPVNPQHPSPAASSSQPGANV